MQFVDSIVAVDVGGTNIRAELFECDGKRASNRIEVPSNAQSGVEKCVQSIVDAIEKAASGKQLSYIAMAVPGHIDGHIVKWAPNFGEEVNGEFVCWRNVNLGDAIQKHFQCTVLMGNDANLASLGEYYYGIGKGTANGLVLLTLGTGIGSGVVLSQNCVMSGLSKPGVFIGGDGGASEFGHICIDFDGWICSCGARGCLEAYCGTAGLLRMALESGVENASEMTPRLLFELAESNDRSAIVAWNRYGKMLGFGISNAINAFAPEFVALGGQISKASKWFLDEARETAYLNSVPSIREDVQIVIAKQIEDAGLLGAASMALQQNHE